MSSFRWGLQFALVAFVVIGQALAEDDFFSGSYNQEGYAFPTSLVPTKSQSQIDLTCFVAVGDAFAHWKSDWLMVDVRNKIQFDQFRVSGSINLPVRDAHRRTFLRDKKVLFMGDGSDVSDIANACQRMKQFGATSVAAVFGGMVGWDQLRLPIEGSVSGAVRLASMPVERFYQLQNADFLTLINVKPERQNEWKSVFPNLISLSAKLNAKDGLSHMGLENKKSRQVVVLIDEDGKTYAKHAALMQQKIAPVFVLAGGMVAYRDYINKQQMMRAYALHPPQRNATCGY